MESRVVLELASEAHTEALGRAIARCIEPGDVIGLDGELGAGKTRLVRAIAAGAGVQDGLVHSPTYVLANNYPTAGGGVPFDELVHVDAYRIDESTMLEDIVDPDQTERLPVCIEWFERIESRAEGWRIGLRVAMEHAGETARVAELTGMRARAVRHAYEHELTRWRFEANQADAVRCRVCGTLVQGVESKSDTGAGGTSAAGGKLAGAFCSDRCRVIDLGQWADESYRISRPIEQSDLETVD